MERSRILQIGSCCAGTPQLLADSSGGGLVYKYPSQYGYHARKEQSIGIPGANERTQKVLSFLSTAKLSKIADDYDLFHFHFDTCLPLGLDIPLWKRMFDKTVYVHHHGTDIRNRGVLHRMSLNRTADKLIVSTPDLIKHAPGSIWVPAPIDIERTNYATLREDDGVLKVLHAPTNRRVKGTDKIVETISRLESKGHNIELSCLTGVNHQTVLKKMAETDVVVDWINPEYGIYGLVSIEAMATGRPVICSINEEYEEYYGELPILKTRGKGEKDLEKHLVSLSEDRSMIRKVSEEGRRYVEAHHDIGAVLSILYDD